jgi:DNA gyrase subunit A
MDIEDLIQREDMVITVSLGGYIKRVPLSTYRAQKRGGKGRSGMTTKDEDVVNDVIVANTHSRILFFSTFGKVYQMKAYRLPLGSPQARGRAMVNLLPLESGETISTVLVMPEVFVEGQEPYLMFATSKGNVRRNRLDDFSNILSNGKRAMRLDEGEQLIAVALCYESDDIMLSTYKGICNRFNVTDIRIFAGRDSNGVRGIRLGKGDHVIAMTILSQGHLALEERQAYLRQATKMRQLANQNEADMIDEGMLEDEENTDYKLTPERFQELAFQEQFILTITENGFGKRSSAYEYRTTNRGSQGYASIAVNARNGGVVASFPVNSDNQILLVTDQGQLIRCPIHDIRIMRRSKTAQGVIIFRVGENEKVVAVSCIPAGEETEDEIEGEEVIVSEAEN